MAKKVKPFGRWQSNLTPEKVSGQSIRFGRVRTEGAFTYWTETRPQEAGRTTLMRWSRNGGAQELLQGPFSARSRVHEYGGGEFLVANGVVYFVNDSDQQIYQFRPGEKPDKLTNEPAMRFADMDFDRLRNRLICVCEREDQAADTHYPENLLVSVELGGAVGAVSDLVTGHDFFAYPSVSADGGRLAFMVWDLPDMPWDSASLWVSDLSDSGAIDAPQRVAGGVDADDTVSAVFQPMWLADGTLTFVSDKSGWGNLYQFNGADIKAIAPMAAEFGLPLWNLGCRTYAPLSDSVIAATFVDDEECRLALISLEDGGVSPVHHDFRSLDQLLHTEDGFAALAVGDDTPPSLIDLSLPKGEVRIVASAATNNLDPEDISRSERLTFHTGTGEAVYALYYPPVNAHFCGPENDQPPILFMVHGGPTGRANRGLNLKTQYWTNRGFAVIDVDYSGSTGYGRDYRDRLNGQWGVRDVADVLAVAQGVLDQRLGNRDQLFISGGSAGGFTVLLSLANSDLFAAGACYYGVSDLKHLLKFTHKFEGGYLYRLLGVSPSDGDNHPVFAERSPVSQAHKISSPVIFFQGLDDNIVPPEQTRLMVESLKTNQVETEMIEFEGEGHGFRQAQTIETALAREYEFYARFLPSE